ncbi:MAG: carbamoyl transferase [Nitrospirae bacterium]|nr:carbamoyl transferase [Nitrospirota bacterium]
MVVLGLNISGRDTSAAIVIDGTVHFAVREERLNREKKSRRFPSMSIDACLRAMNISMRDVELISVSWNPAINLERFNYAQSSVSRYKPEHFYSVANHLLAFFPEGAGLISEQRLHLAGGGVVNISYVNHHLCHAAGTFLQSPFEDAAIVVMDAYGERDSSTLAYGSGNAIKVIKTIPFPHSVGSFYGTMTQYLGFTPDMDEWKLMGAAPYGDPLRYYNALRSMVALDNDGGFTLDLSYFDYPTFQRTDMFSQKLVSVLGPPRQHGEELDARHFDIAAATQRVTEDIVFHMLRALYKQTSTQNLCLSGGVAMNSIINGKVAADTPFRDIFVGPAPDDGGTSVGAALFVCCSSEDFARHAITSNYWGNGYTDDDIEMDLKKYAIPYRKSANVAGDAAAVVAAGNIIGWFQGRMEFGERALGARSIIADPRDESMKNKVNTAIKYRETFRPFAPSVLAEDVDLYFGQGQEALFMEKVLPVRPDKRSLIPAVVHVDGSGRLQSVHRDVNPMFWSLINEFKTLTGIGVVLNTSFNLQGEPIVCTPRDAIRTFFSSGLDYLFMGNFIVNKSVV